VLAVRLGPVHQVSYNLTTGNTAHRRLNLNGHRVRLGGFHAQHPHTIDVIASTGTRVTLLVLTPETHQATAHHILMTTARPDNTDSINTLLALTHTPEPVPAHTDLMSPTT
jgi:hypothetical protein